MSIRIPVGFERRGNRIVRVRAEDATGKNADAADMKCAQCGALVQLGWKFCPECGADLGAAEGPPAGEARAFAIFALGELGERTLDGGRGALIAMKEQAGRERASAEQLSTLERERVLERAIVEGRISADLAWDFSVGADGEKVRTFSTWAGPPSSDGKTGQSLEQLRAYLSRQEPRPSGRLRTPASPPAGAAPRSLTAEDKEFCRVNKLDDNIYAERKYGAQRVTS